MANILIFVNPNVGSPIASMQLATDLRGRGHTVRYLGLEDSSEAVVANGFEFIPVFAKHFPKGILREYSIIHTLPFGPEYIRAMRKHALRFKAFFDDLLSQEGEEFLALLQALRPDLLIFASGASHMEWIAILAGSIGIQCICCNDMLMSPPASGLPPYSSDNIPEHTLSSSIRTLLAWQRLKIGDGFGDFLGWLFAGIHFGGFSKKLAGKYRYPTDKSRHSRRRNCVISLPELILFPKEFDFPASEIPGRYHVEASLYLTRRQAEFPWHELAENQPVLYCALGSVVPYGGTAKALYRAVISASGIRPDWKWVIAVGGNNDLTELGPVPHNVLLVDKAPQLDLLPRVKIMITHGGANTVKECIYFGVPMIVFPFLATTDTDQPGNSARVRYHGLGVQGDCKRLDAAYLAQLIDTVDRDPYIRSQVNIMQGIFRKAENDKPGIRLIETILAQ